MSSLHVLMSCGMRSLNRARIVVLLAMIASTQAKQVVNLANYVPLQLCGLGRYSTSPALFLEETRGGSVLPIPIPGEAVMATEQALSPVQPSLIEVVLHAQAVSKRDDGFFDNLPWEWNPSAQGKRDAFARFSGRGYPREGYPSSYHLMLDMMRRDACADVSHVLLENTELVGGLVVGGALILERRLPPTGGDSGAKYAMGAGPAPLADGRWWRQGPSASADDDDGPVSEDAFVCECTADEAMGIALALGDARVYVDRRVWEQCCMKPSYSTQRGKMRIEVAAPAEDGDGGLEDGRSGVEAAGVAPPLPWEIKSTNELLGLSLRDKALSALGAGLRLPRAREATDERLTELLEPFLDETVRRELAVRRALEQGDEAEAARLEAGASKRSELRRALAEAVAEERFGRAAELAMELQVETSRRMDVTLDEGSYDRFLDQDDWYAQGLARERERLLAKEREKILEKDERQAQLRAMEEEEEARKQNERRAAEAEAEAEAEEEEEAKAKADTETEAKAEAEAKAQAKAETEAAAVKAAAEVPDLTDGPKPAAGGFRYDTGLPPAQRLNKGASRVEVNKGASRVEVDTEWTEDLQSKVLRQMVFAFDNYQEAEVEALLSALVDAASRGEADAERSLRKLALLTRQMLSLEKAASRGSEELVVLEDQARALRAQIRMWGKDGERYLDQGDSWLSWLNQLGKDL